MRSLLAATSILMISASLVACTQTDTIDAPEDADEPTLQTMEGHGSTGTNGLLSNEAVAHQHRLITMARTYPLVYPGTTNTLNPWIYYDTADPTWAHVLKYAVQCASSKTLSLGSSSFVGRGILKDVGPAWMSRPLTKPEIATLIACVAAFQNPTGVHVAVLLSGAAITDQELLPVLYDVPEALWQVYLDLDWGVHYMVYPFDHLTQACSNPAAALSMRVCGESPDQCHMNTGDYHSCTLTRTGYECNGQPAMETALLDSGFYDLYGGNCSVPVP